MEPSRSTEDNAVGSLLLSKATNGAGRAPIWHITPSSATEPSPTRTTLPSPARSSLTLSRPVEDGSTTNVRAAQTTVGERGRCGLGDSEERQRQRVNERHVHDNTLTRPRSPLQAVNNKNEHLSISDEGRQPSSSSSILQDSAAPALLSQLSSHDKESVLVLAVDDGDDNLVMDNGERVAKAQHGGSGGGLIYAGSQGGDIHIWDLDTMTLKGRLTGHEGAVLALQIVKSRNWLISASGDGTVRVWHTTTMTPLYLIQPPHDNIGDVLSLAWVGSDLLDFEQRAQGSSRSVKGKGRLYAGCQDTSVMWIDLPPAFHLDALSSAPLGSPLASILSSSPGASSPPVHRTPNRFFDQLTTLDRVRSRGSGGGLHRNGASSSSLNAMMKDAADQSTATPEACTPPTSQQQQQDGNVIELQFQLSCIATCAHYGYVYCMTVARSNDKVVLVTGAGDERIKIWRMQQHELDLVTTLDSTSDAVLAVATRDSTLFAGHQGGVIKIWDLDTFTCVRNLRPHSDDILTLTVSGDFLYSGSADGTIQRWNKAFNLAASWQAHDGIVLSSTSSRTSRNGRKFFSGGNDNVVRVWDATQDEKLMDEGMAKGFQGELFHRLSRFIAYKSVSDESNREECRQAAQYLKRVLRELGAETKLLPGAAGRNPLVLATFRANAHSSHPNGPTKPSPLAPSPAPPKKRVLFYGHYDIVPASAPEMWTSDPFKLVGKDGWLYGRGVTDNKGPILAVAGAASELKGQGLLDVDVVMLVEGEEESGSEGFKEAVREFKDLIGPIDVILVSNSYWIGEDVPCLTFGLRGVIHATLKIVSDLPDLHSGMQGGVVSEPLVDMVRLLASLTDSQGRVLVPGFMDDVRHLSAQENALYDAVVSRCSGKKSDKLRKHSHIADPKQSLISRWREPALSIHDVASAGPNQKSLIPSWASATVSIRIVPDQSLQEMVQQLRQFLQARFSQLRTANQLEIDIPHVADWWLGDVKSPYFTALASCIESTWGVKPLFIREGGSIPSLPFLEREFQADAVHFPMGTSEDHAHLPDERIRIVNLENGKKILSQWLTRLASL
ncbi:hypothetical protein ACM66B_003203 [Microbotryomycetes sp. NB124-2]